MLSLLEQMSKRDLGTLHVVKPGDGQTGEGHRRHHHMELLVDAGHADWVNDSHHVARITNAGYDFLNAVRNPKTGERAMSEFIRFFNSGVPYVHAPQSVVNLVAKVTGV